MPLQLTSCLLESGGSGNDGNSVMISGSRRHLSWTFRETNGTKDALPGLLVQNPRSRYDPAGQMSGHGFHPWVGSLGAIGQLESQTGQSRGALSLLPTPALAMRVCRGDGQVRTPSCPSPGRARDWMV
jgi:hypothetical protein